METKININKKEENYPDYSKYFLNLLEIKFAKFNTKKKRNAMVFFANFISNLFPNIYQF